MINLPDLLYTFILVVIVLVFVFLPLIDFIIVKYEKRQARLARYVITTSEKAGSFYFEIYDCFKGEQLKVPNVYYNVNKKFKNLKVVHGNEKCETFCTSHSQTKQAAKTWLKERVDQEDELNFSFGESLPRKHYTRG